jgi:hypothetical protein
MQQPAVTEDASEHPDGHNIFCIPGVPWPLCCTLGFGGGQDMGREVAYAEYINQHAAPQSWQGTAWRAGSQAGAGEPA